MSEEKKGFIVVDLQKNQAYRITDRKDVAKLLEVHPNTVGNRIKSGWFKTSRFLVFKQYIDIKSTRGRN